MADEPFITADDIAEAVEDLTRFQAEYMEAGAITGPGEIDHEKMARYIWTLFNYLSADGYVAMQLAQAMSLQWTGKHDAGDDGATGFNSGFIEGFTHGVAAMTVAMVAKGLPESVARAHRDRAKRAGRPGPSRELGILKQPPGPRPGQRGNGAPKRRRRRRR